MIQENNGMKSTKEIFIAEKNRLAKSSAFIAPTAPYKVPLKTKLILQI